MTNFITTVIVNHKLKASSFIIVLLDYDSFSLGRKLRRSFANGNGTTVENCS